MIYKGAPRGNPRLRARETGVEAVQTLEYDDLDAEDRALLDAARDATSTAYAPYSGVRVGAALRLADGEIVTASNVENAAYGATICAERMAVGRANAMGRRDIRSVAVTARGGALGEDQVVTPCGPCRQVLHEMAALSGSTLRVVMGTPGTARVTIATIDQLLPLAFDGLTR